MKAVIGITVSLIFLGGGGALFLGPKVNDYLSSQRQSGLGEEVEIETVAAGELVRTVSAPGSVIPKTSVNISSRVSGNLIALPFAPGDAVREGEILAEIDPKELQARLSAAEARLLAEKAQLASVRASLAAEEAGLAGLRASLDNAVREYERQSELHASGDVSRAAYEAAQAERDRQESAYRSRVASIEGAKANVESAQAGVAVAQASVDEARENLGYTVIRSPITGVVTSLNSKVGETVLGTVQNIGTTIMTVADLSEMLVEAQLSELDAPKVIEGQRVRIAVSGYRGEEFAGELRHVGLQSKASSDGTSYFDAEVLLTLEEGQRMLSGLTASVDIEVETIEGLVTVPSQAVKDIRVEDLPREIRKDPLVPENRTFAQVVFVFDPATSTVKMRPVNVRASNLTHTAIEAGIEVGDRIITGPFRVLKNLNDGAKVRDIDAGEDDSEDASASESETETEPASEAEKDDAA